MLRVPPAADTNSWNRWALGLRARSGSAAWRPGRGPAPGQGLGVRERTTNRFLEKFTRPKLSTCGLSSSGRGSACRGRSIALVRRLSQSSRDISTLDTSGIVVSISLALGLVLSLSWILTRRTNVQYCCSDFVRTGQVDAGGGHHAAIAPPQHHSPRGSSGHTRTGK